MLLIYLMRDALNVMTPVLWCWPMIPEVNVGSMAVEAETSHQYITLCSRVTDGSRGAVWQNGKWHASVYETKCGIEFQAEKIAVTVLYPCLLSIYGDQTEDVSTDIEDVSFGWRISAVAIAGHLHWCRFLQVERIQVLVQWWWWKCTGNVGDYTEKQCCVAENLFCETELLWSLDL